MFRPANSLPLRYGSALAAVALAAGVRLALDPWVGDRSPFITFLAAVVFTAWYGGFGPSLLALAVGWLSAAFFIVEPRGSLLIRGSEAQAASAVFALVGLAVALMGGAARAARRRAEATTDEQVRLAEYGRDIGLALTRSATLVDALDQCARATVKHLDGAFARIWTASEEGGMLELRASAGMYTHTDGAHSRIPVGQYKIGQIALERKPHLTNAVIGDPRVPAQDWARQEGMVAFAGYPLVVEDRLVGVLAMFARHPLTETTLQRMASVADEVAIGIERKRAEERLHRQREWLRVTLSSVGDAVIATDTGGRVTFLNPVAEALTGWPQAQAAGEPLDDVFRVVNEESRLPVESPAARAMREGTVVGLANHTLLIARDGSERAIDDSAAPIRDEAGSVIGAVLIFRDAEERRRAERVLEESEARKAAILQTALDAIITIDHAGDVVEWNPAAERIFGYERAEVMGREMCQLIIPPALRDAHRRGLARYLATGEGPVLGRRIEITAARADGTEFPIELAIARIPLGGPPLFTAHARDVTERKTAETTLRDSEERYRTLTDLSPQAVWSARADGHVTFFNKWWLDYTGLTAERSNGDGWTQAVHPDHRERVVDIRLDAAERGVSWDAEIPFRRASDGTYRWHLARGMPVRDESGRVVKWVGVAIDIHDRKQTEDERDRLLGQLDAERKHLQAVIESSQDCIKELDLDGRLVAISATGQRLLEVRDPCEILGKNWVDFWQGADREAAQAAIEKASAGGVGSFEGFCRTAAGTPRWWDVVVTPIFDTTGRPQRLLSVSKDVTDRRRHAEERERLLVEAQEANRAKDQFLAVLSHELRTPLNPILLAASSMLERPTAPEDFRPTLEMIRHNVNLQARLIDDLLDVMRIVQGKMPLHWGVVDCHTVIGHAVQVCQSEVFGKVIGLTLDLAATRHHVNADSARLQQVFWNLIKNAVKFSPEGGALTIRTRNEGRGGERLVIEVSDTGIGIEPDVLPTIFDPFQQGETSITRRFGGLGLGLAISRGVIEAHGGTIAAESEGKGRGTTFRVVLEALPNAAVGGNGQPPEAAAPLSEDGSPARALKILLVEDEPATQRLMARLLRGLGHEVTTAGTTAEATAASLAGEFGLIISDVGLPDGSGLDVMRRVVARRGKVPSIALTGYGMEEDILRSREAGFTAHMTKPIDFTKLEAMIRQITA